MYWGTGWPLLPKYMCFQGSFSPFYVTTDGKYVKVSDYGHISLNGIFLPLFPHFKLTQLFNRIFNIPWHSLQAGA